MPVFSAEPINLARTMELKLSGDLKLNPGPAAREQLGKLTPLCMGARNCRVMGQCCTLTSMLYREKTCST